MTSQGPGARRAGPSVPAYERPATTSPCSGSSVSVPGGCMPTLCPTSPLPLPIPVQKPQTGRFEQMDEAGEQGMGRHPWGGQVLSHHLPPRRHMLTASISTPSQRLREDKKWGPSATAPRASPLLTHHWPHYVTPQLAGVHGPSNRAQLASPEKHLRHFPELGPEPQNSGSL